MPPAERADGDILARMGPLEFKTNSMASVCLARSLCPKYERILAPHFLLIQLFIIIAWNLDCATESRPRALRSNCSTWPTKCSSLFARSPTS